MRYQIGGLDAEDRDRLGELTASTLHRLLQPRPGSSSRFRHHRENRLPHDVVVVDETSMVSLTLMARLLEAVRPDSRLLLVGDADQLASVEAGAVLADLVEGLGGRADVRVAALQTSHRFGANIGALAGAIRRGEAEQVLELLRTGGDHLEWLDGEEPTEQLRGPLLEQATLLRRAAILGDADAAVRALDGHRLLCAPARPTASRIGTTRCSGGWPTRPGNRCGRSGTRAGRCWSRPTTTDCGCSMATPG